MQGRQAGSCTEGHGKQGRQADLGREGRVVRKDRQAGRASRPDRQGRAGG